MPTVGTLTFHQYNDETVLATLYADVERTTPLDLTGCAVEFIYKTSNAQADEDALILPCTVVDAIDGTITVNVNNEIVSMLHKFFRIDVIAGTERKTAVYGAITVIDL